MLAEANNYFKVLKKKTLPWVCTNCQEKRTCFEYKAHTTQVVLFILEAKFCILNKFPGGVNITVQSSSKKYDFPSIYEDPQVLIPSI